MGGSNQPPCRGDLGCGSRTSKRWACNRSRRDQGRLVEARRHSDQPERAFVQALAAVRGTGSRTAARLRTVAADCAIPGDCAGKIRHHDGRSAYGVLRRFPMSSPPSPTFANTRSLANSIQSCREGYGRQQPTAIAAATSVAAHGRRSDGPAIGAVETKGDWSKRAATLISPNAPSFKHLRRSVGQGPGPRLGCAQFQRCCPIPSSRGVPGGSRDARPAKSRLRELALACRFAAEPAPRRPENTAAERGRRRKRLPSAETQSEFLSPRARARDPNAQRLYGGFQPFIDLGRGPSSRWRGSGPWLPVQDLGTTSAVDMIRPKRKKTQPRMPDAQGCYPESGFE